MISIAQSDSSKYNFFDKQSFKNIFNSIEIINPHKLSVGLKTGVVYDVDFSELDIESVVNRSISKLKFNINYTIFSPADSLDEFNYFIQLKLH